MCIKELGVEVDMRQIDMYKKAEHIKPWFVKVVLICIFYHIMCIICKYWLFISMRFFVVDEPPAYGAHHRPRGIHLMGKVIQILIHI